MDSLKMLSLLQVSISLTQLISVLNSLKCLNEISFTLPKADSVQATKQFDCFTNLLKLEIDISNHYTYLQYLLDNCLNLTDLKLINLKANLNNTSSEYQLNISQLKGLRSLLILNNPNILIDQDILFDKINHFLSKFQINFKQEFQIIDVNINYSFNNSLKWMTKIHKPIESFELIFNVFKSNKIQSSHAFMFLEFDIESFLSYLSRQYLKSFIIRIMHTAHLTKFCFIINEIGNLRNFNCLRCLDLSQIHVHVNYNFCEILTKFKCMDNFIIFYKSYLIFIVFKF